MFDWQAFHFIRPLWLLALIPLAGIIYFYLQRHSSASNWSHVCDAHLLKHLLVTQEKQGSRTALWLLSISWLLACLALAGPTWSKLEQPLYQSEEALVIVMDLSRSMDANDLSPSRMNLAKFKLIDLLKSQQDGKAALIVYAAEPYVVSPLTNDTETIISQVPALSTALMPQQGSHASLALEKAGELMRHAGVPKGHILLITDGVSSTAAVNDIAQNLKDRQIKTSVLAVGTQEGAPIPLPEGGFLKDAQGSIVIPQLDHTQLQSLATAGGGLYQTLTSSQQDIRRLSAFFIGQSGFENAEDTQQTTDTWREQGPWLALLLLPFAALAFRKGWVAVFFVCLSLPMQESYAFEWQDLWLTPNQQAARALEKNDLETASQRFEDPNWQGVTHYQKGDYEKAAEAFQNINTPDAHYNRANALAKAGKLEEAIKAYEQALEQQPEHEDAKFNRDLVQSLLDQQQEQKQEQQSQDGESQDNQQNDASQQQGEQQQNNPQSSSQENPEQQDATQANNEQDAKEQSEQQAMNQQQQEEAQDEASAEEQQAQQQDAETANEEQQQSMLQDDLTAAEQESQQAVEQWLRRIPDDPGGLLRRKFIREHQKQTINPSSNISEQPW